MPVRYHLPLLHDPSLFLPIELNYQDVSQANAAPGFGLTDVPAGLADNALAISSGSTFSVGIDKDGNVYEWGTFPTDKLRNIPSSSEMGKLTMISAGLDHVLAVNEDGQIFTWGNDRMGLTSIPVELRSQPSAHQADLGRLPVLAGIDRERPPVQLGQRLSAEHLFPRRCPGQHRPF